MYASTFNWQTSSVGFALAYLASWNWIPRHSDLFIHFHVLSNVSNIFSENTNCFVKLSRIVHFPTLSIIRLQGFLAMFWTLWLRIQ